MTPGQFREAFDILAGAVDDVRAQFHPSPSEMLSMLGRVLAPLSWQAGPDFGASKSDMRGMHGSLVLVVRMEVKR